MMPDDLLHVRVHRTLPSGMLFCCASRCRHACSKSASATPFARRANTLAHVRGLASNALGRRPWLC